MQESMKDVTSQVVVPRRPLGRRVTCHYYSPALVLSQNDEKRLQVVQELLETEESYLSCLRNLSVIEDKLCSSFIIPIKDLETIFPVELKEIREVHECLYYTLKKKVEQWSDRSTVGDIFVDFVSDNHQFDLLGLYSSYSNKFKKAIRTINKCVKNYCQFEDFLQTPSTSVTCKGLDLQALLLNPIQRLPRYLLLFKQVMKFTDVNHPDRVHVEQALETLSNTITILNSSIQRSLKVASGLTHKKRATRRRLSCQKDSITVCHRVSEQHVLSLSPDAKVNQDESTSSWPTPPPQSARPTSVCSSVSSGYASDEGESFPLNNCTSNEMTSCEGNADFTRLVQDLRQPSALELEQQKFDFSVSSISPSLQRLQILKFQDEKETDNDKNHCPVIPKRKCAVSFRDDETMHLTPRGNEVCSLVATENSIDLNNNILQQNNDLETGCSSMNAVDNQQANGEQLLIQPREHRSYTEAVTMGPQITDFASCDSLKNRGLATPEETSRSTRSNKLSMFQKFNKHRRSWSSFSTQYSDNTFSRWGNRSLFTSLDGEMFGKDSPSIASDLSTMSEESSVSSMSTVSAPVLGRHTSKKIYHKLKELFRSIRSKHQGSSYQNTMPKTPQNDVITIQRPVVIPLMMISAV